MRNRSTTTAAHVPSKRLLTCSLNEVRVTFGGTTGGSAGNSVVRVMAMGRSPERQAWSMMAGFGLRMMAL